MPATILPFVRPAIAGHGPDHAPAEIQTIWAEMNRLVEPRNGHPGLEFSEVSIVGK